MQARHGRRPPSKCAHDSVSNPETGHCRKCESFNKRELVEWSVIFDLPVSRVSTKATLCENLQTYIRENGGEMWQLLADLDHESKVSRQETKIVISKQEVAREKAIKALEKVEVYDDDILRALEKLKATTISTPLPPAAEQGLTPEQMAAMRSKRAFVDMEERRRGVKREARKHKELYIIRDTPDLTIRFPENDEKADIYYKNKLVRQYDGVLSVYESTGFYPWILLTLNNGRLVYVGRTHLGPTIYETELGKGDTKIVGNDRHGVAMSEKYAYLLFHGYIAELDDYNRREPMLATGQENPNVFAPLSFKNFLAL